MMDEGVNITAYNYKAAVKAFLVHAIPPIIVWGGLGFPFDRIALALVITAELTGIFDFVKEM
jgi:hypothetical protein